MYKTIELTDTFNGLEPIGFWKDGRPIYPIMGGAPKEGEGDEGADDGADEGGAADDAGAQDDSDDDGAGDGADDGPVTFESRDAFVKAVNKIVKTRLDRNNRKYAPVVAERDTLKKKVDELSSAGDQATQTEQRAKQMQSQLDELLSYKATTERNELVRSIAKEKGLPDEFIPRVQGTDPDSIAEDVEELVDLLKVDGKPRSVSKTTKPASKDEGKGGKGGSGKGGSDDDTKFDPAEVAKKVGRYGHRPIFMG